MKNLVIIAIILLLSLGGNVQAQKVKVKANGKTSTVKLDKKDEKKPKEKKHSQQLDTIPKKYLDVAEYKILYKHSYVPNTALPEKRKEGLALLLVGKQNAWFLDYHLYRSWMISDSLGRLGTPTANILPQVLPLVYKSIITEDVYRHYPKPSQSYICTRIGFENASYTDDVPTIDWQLVGNDTTDILGFKCKQAECEFRGRRYIAFYTEELPISEGPWLFGGLPGLILSIESVDKEYSYIIEGIEHLTTNSDPIFISLNDMGNEMTRDDCRKALQNYYGGVVDVAAQLAERGIEVESDADTQNALQHGKARPYNPIEKE